MSHKPFLEDTVFAALYVFTAELWGVEYAASALYRYYHDTASLTLSEPLRLGKQLIDSISV